MNELLVPRTPGGALKAAREKRRLSVREVAEATRIKPHIIEALERDDYSEMTVPLYGKSFIRLYASHVGLDPAPLIEHYLNYYARIVRPTLKTEVPPPSAVNDGIPQPSPLARFKESSDSTLTNLTNSVTTAARDALQGLIRAWCRMQASGQGTARDRFRAMRDRLAEDSEPIPVGRYAAIGFAAVVVVMLAGSLLYWMVGSKETLVVMPGPVSTQVQDSAPVKASRPLRLLAPPPAPYLKLK